ncbi:hypothetical protein [sulfur-oxidizing endosymbiont of Gigantopelta aegis]|uniref:hypothetical protein n=1 Tax=sulfur-oxidizing endosymbiont of Gigantopelta aegis TaxID=2794934 RepID=UPI0018DC688C|nr:hypothetical protein [sulfur-oxidizing endosymbiont of Gigantopelta aegis]
MLDYIFFHETPLKKFQKYLDKKEIPYKNDTEFQASVEETGFTISISDDYERDILKQIEDFYDEMMELNAELISADEEIEEISNAGISVQLADGSTVLADVDANLIYKLSDALTPKEILELVHAIASAVENPDKRPLCKR